MLRLLSVMYLWHGAMIPVFVFFFEKLDVSDSFILLLTDRFVYQGCYLCFEEKMDPSLLMVSISASTPLNSLVYASAYTGSLG